MGKLHGCNYKWNQAKTNDTDVITNERLWTNDTDVITTDRVYGQTTWM